MPSAQRRPGAFRAAAGGPSLPSSSTPSEAGTGTVLAFDYGEKRIGVAVGELSLGVAHPLAMLRAEGRERQLAAIAPLVREWCPALLVVGLPSHPDGGEHELTRAARRFAARLEAAFAVPAILVDERYTSAMAESALVEIGVPQKRRKSVLDPMAAQQILQAYFDERH